MFLKNDLITIRDLTKEDIPFMLKWLTNDKVLKYYEGRDTHFNIESISNKFLTDIPNGFRLIIEYKNIPIGYCQYYKLDKNLLEEYEYSNNLTIIGIDQFIGEPDYWNKGIGTQFLQMMIEYFITQTMIDYIILDPRKTNNRAIRAYEKAGFNIKKELPKHELFEGKYEDCLLMEKKL